MEGHGGDDHPRQGLQDSLQPFSDVLVQDAVPPVPVHELRDGDGQREVRPLLVQGPQVVDQRGDLDAVRRDDDLKRQIVSPCPPVAEEPVSLLRGAADMQRERGVAERGSVR